MADAIVKLPDDSANTGPKIDNDSLIVGANTVNRQRVRMAGAGATDVAPVTAADGLLVNLGANNDVVVSGVVAITGTAGVTIEGQSGALTLDSSKVLGTNTYTETSTTAQLVGVVRRDADTTLVSATNEIAPLQVDARGFLKVEVFSGAEAIPVSAAALPLPAGAATEATLGTAASSLASIDAGIPAALAAGGGMKVEGVAGGVPQPVTGTVAVSGTVPVSAAALPLPAGAATESTLAAAAASLASIDTGIPAALAAGGGMKVEGVAGGVAVPVSLASQPLPTGAATEVTLAAAAASLAAIDAGIPAALAANGGMKVEGVAGGVPIPISGAGGTQYAEGSTQAAITGTAILWEDAADVVRAVSAIKPLPVNIAGAGTVVSVAVTSALPAGNANIGDVDVATLPTIGQLPAALAAGGGLKVEGVSGGVPVTTAAPPVTGAVVDGTTSLTPKFATVNATASADLIALVSAKKLRVLSAFMIANADGTINLRSGGAGTLTGVMTVRQGGGFVLPFNPCGWFETAAGAKLDVVLGTITQLSGTITYIEV